MNVLITGVDDDLGGIQTFVLNYFRDYADKNLNVHFLILTDKFYIRDNELFPKAIYHTVTSRRKSFIKYMKEITDILRNDAYAIDLVYMNLMTCSSIEVGYIAKLLHKKLVIHCHSIWKGSKIGIQIRHGVNKNMISAIADARFSCSYAAGKWMFGKKPFQVISNAIDVSAYKFDYSKRLKIRHRLGISGRFVLGHVGRIEEEKNHKFLIDIFLRVKKKIPNAVLLCVGDGTYRSKLEKYMDSIGCAQEVCLIGWTQDVPDYLSAMDAFAFPSKYEGLGIAVIEAQCAGLPCYVSTEVPREVNQTGHVKFLELSKNADAWALAVTKDYISGNQPDRTKAYQTFLDGSYDLKRRKSEFFKILQEWCEI